MKIIVPMAGMGKRMRPHTLTVPKPLIKVAGKTIVQRLMEDISAMFDEPIEEIAFVVGHFGEEVENDLIKIAESLNAKGSIHYQEEALGTAHAILCAESALDGKTVVAFADTLFRADFALDSEADGILFVQEIENPEQFGVVKLDDSGHIVDFIEKPATPVSNLAMIGIYYFKDGAALKREIQRLIDENIIKGGEYQLPDALHNMTKKGMKFAVGRVEDWMDCGNKNATVQTNASVLKYQGKNEIHETAKLENAQVIEPCFIGPGVHIVNSVVGPFASIGSGSAISNSRIWNSIIQENSHIEKAVVENSMIGSFSNVQGNCLELSISDYSTIKG